MRENCSVREISVIHMHPGTGKTGISIAIINLREKGKMREIERIINKKFIMGEMPSGKQILLCTSKSAGPFSPSSARGSFVQ